MGQGYRALRRGRHSLAGQVYLVTFTTHDRRDHFSSWDIAAQMARLIGDSDLWKPSQLLAWVLMPDHWHGLIELGEGDTLSRRIALIKGGTAHQLGQSHPALGALWREGFHDRALRRHEDVQSAARYLVMNPKRAGLVARAGDYPFWDAVWLQG